MKTINFAYLTGRYDTTPPEFVGMYPLGGGGIFEAAYRHYFEWHTLKRLLPLAKSQVLLELGSGNGRWASSFSPLVRRYIGIDSTAECVSIAKIMLEDQHLNNVSFIHDSIINHKPDCKLDILYFSGVSQYLQDEEIRIVLKNIHPWLQDDALIVDRSTFQSLERKVTNSEGYFSIYRTVDELSSLLFEQGFALVARSPSYRHLSIGPWLIRLTQYRPRIKALLLQILNKTQPFSLWVMFLLSYLLDSFPLRQNKKADWSHDFLVFKKKSSP